MTVDKWDQRFLDLASLVSTWSKDPSTQTGAVITCGKQVVSLGFNGFPMRMPDMPEWYANREGKYSRIVHCEINALIFAKQDVHACTLYTWPFISCDRCFVTMAQAGIWRFVAPKPTEEQAQRWGPAFDRVRQYAQEMGLELVEVDLR